MKSDESTTSTAGHRRSGTSPAPRRATNKGSGLLSALASSVNPTDRQLLLHWSRSGTVPVRVATRSRIVLLALEQAHLTEVAARCGVRSKTVRLWAARVVAEGVATIWHDAPGRGRRSSIDAETIRAIAELANETAPRAGSLRAVASRFGVSTSTVQRIWRTAASRCRVMTG